MMNDINRDPLFPNAFFNGRTWDMAGTGEGHDYMTVLSGKLFDPTRYSAFKHDWAVANWEYAQLTARWAYPNTIGG